uniref:Uncharacterized protein n=1 Tax=Anopheles minimus TaxID=112268 RepID=A0A182WLA1_9DIPT
MVFCSCSFLSCYLLTAVVSYVAVYILQVVLDLPLWEGQQQHHSPSDQHFELKRLIQKILEEIAKLPELLNHSGLPLRPEEHLPYFDPKKYEQLLATAVLNKVVDDYRNPKNFTNSGDVAGNSTGGATPYGTVDINHNQLSEEASIQGLRNKETLRQMSVTADDVHLHEGVSYTAPSERRLSDTDESYLSDYIQRHKVPLPDLSDTTGSGSGAEDDDLQSLKSNATDGTWEENWLFRKRQLKTTESSIAMLVPSPTEEVKALIGDKNADEISDLSEAGSDCEGYESDSNVNAGRASEQSPAAAIASSSKDTSEGISSSSKTQDSLEEQLPHDSLVSINSLPVNEDVLSEATNSQLLAEQSTENQPNGHSTAGLVNDDLISMEPESAEKVETTNPALTNPFLEDAFEANNNVITDDVKLLQRTEAVDNRSSATESNTNGYGDRKEIPIDRAHQQQKTPHISPSNPVVIVAESNSSVSVADSTTGNGASDDNIPEGIDGSKCTNKPECFEQPKVSQQLLLLDSRSPPDSPIQQVLSPHPIMMTITDVFDRLANSSPLTAISEEQPPAIFQDLVETEPIQIAEPVETTLEVITEEGSPSVEIKQPILLPADSMQTEPDDDCEYQTMSEATNNSLPLAESFDALESFDAYEQANDASLLIGQDDEFCSLLEENGPNETTSQTSPDLLQIRETPPAALYVRNHDQLEFSEQLQTLEQTTAVVKQDPFKCTEQDTPTRITLQPDLVTFDNNAPSPEGPPGIGAVTEQMRAYCEELKNMLNHPAELSEESDLPPFPEAEPEQWELVESPEELEALAAFREELQIAVNDPAQTEVRPCNDHPIRDVPLVDLDERFPSPIEIAGQQMAEYSDSLKNIEYVEEAIVMDEETVPLVECSIEPSESQQALRVTSPEPPPPLVTVVHTPSAEQSATTVTTDSEDPSFEDPSTTTTEESMLESIESRSESKIEDTSMPFSDTELPSLSSPFTSFSTNTTFTMSATINNNCMSTNPTEQASPPSIDTNHSNSNESIVCAPSPDTVVLEEPQELGSVADACSIVAAQKEPTHPQGTTNGDDGRTSQNDAEDHEASLDMSDTLIPGSIAEREHMKWRNAKPIANNPYSPDALQRRLSEKSRPNSMIEIDRLVRKEAAPAAGDTGVLMDDENPPKEPTDSGTENDRSLQSVTGGVLAEKKKIGREYYINDPERLRTGGAPVKQTLGVQQQPHQQSHSTDDEKVSHQTYYTLPTDSYIMDRFLNNAPTTVGRSSSIRSIRSLPQHELSHSGSSTLHRAASVDLGYQTKTPSAAGSDTAVDIPAHILAQFEQETLHSDYKRDSFRARHATTRQFVLNPIFDEQASPGPDGTGDERSATHTIPRKACSNRRVVGTAGTHETSRTSSGPVVETVFTDLCTLRRSASSLLLGRNVDDGTLMQQKLSPDQSGNSLYRSSSFGKQRDPKAEDIFAARPIQVMADDPILKHGTKVNYLSTAAREIFLVPLEPEPNGSLISTSSELSSVHSPSRPELDSLTYSEDSDVTRIYDLTTGEAKVVRANETDPIPVHDTILQILPQSSPISPVKSVNTSHTAVPASGNAVSALKSQLSTGDRMDERTQARRSPFPVKPLSPETIKFFAPKRKLSFTGSTNSLVSETAKGCEQGTIHVLPSMHSSLHIDFPATRTATGSEFAIIEKDVIDVLPSVKELAKCYSGSTSDVSSMPPKPLYKPRDFIRQSSDVLNEDGMPSVGAKGQRQYSSTSSIAVRDEIREIRKLNLEAYRQSTYYPMAPGHSITARSLSKQIREHKANNVTDDHKVGQQEEPLPAGDGMDVNGEGNGEGNGDDDGHTSPERPGSPVLLPGHLKSSIEFFESLKNKP